MTKLACLILGLMVLVPAACGHAAATDHEKTDAAFDSGNPTLTETGSASVKPEASDFVLSEEAKAFLMESSGEEYDEALSAALSETEFVLFSRSPSGNSGIIAAGAGAITFCDGRYHIVYPSAIGGEDEYSNLAKYYKNFSGRFRSLIGEEGIVYSQDGRYAAISNIKTILMSMQYFIDPILIDLSTGELILTATYPGNLMKDENAGAVSSAVFSSDSQYFYYILSGRSGDARVRLYRYNLGTGETELCFQSEKNLFYPHLAELEDGSLLMINDVTELNQTESLVIASYDNGVWSMKEEQLKHERALFYVRRLTYSPNAGLACLMGNTMMNGETSVAFQLVNPSNGFEGINQFWSIRKDTDEIVCLSPEEYKEAILANVQQSDRGYSLSLQYPYQTIYNTVFSPDGKYLLLHTSCYSEEGNSRKLFLIRLDDMAVRKVSGLNAEKIPVAAMSSQYPMNIEWNTDELIIGTDDGIKTYEFTAGD